MVAPVSKLRRCLGWARAAGLGLAAGLLASSVCAQAPQRVVSLLPSATEAVCALGACERLVGVDSFSLDPPQVAALPRVGNPWQPQWETLLQLRPDLVLVGRAPHVQQQLRRLGLRLLEVDAQRLDEVPTVLQRLDQALGTDQAPAVLQAMEARLQALQQVARSLPPQRVYVEVDAALYSAAEHSFMGALLQHLGAHNIAPSQGPAFPKLSPEYVVQQAPQLVIQTYDAQHHAVAARPGWGPGAGGGNWTHLYVDPRGAARDDTPGATLGRGSRRFFALSAHA